MDTHHERRSRRSAVAVLADADVGGGASMGHGFYFWHLVEENHGTRESPRYIQRVGVGGRGAGSCEKKYPLPQRSLPTKARTLCPGTTATLALCKTQTLSDCKNTLPLPEDIAPVKKHYHCSRKHGLSARTFCPLQGHAVLCENAFLSSARTPWPL